MTFLFSKFLDFDIPQFQLSLQSAVILFLSSLLLQSHKSKLESKKYIFHSVLLVTAQVIALHQCSFLGDKTTFVWPLPHNTLLHVILKILDIFLKPYVALE